MTVTPSTMLRLGTQAPDFSLPDTDGNLVTLGSFRASKALLVMFICNHCPYVKHLADALASFAVEYAPQGLDCVAINSNDATTHPHDGPQKMIAEKAARDYRFPYLFDADQEVAKAYRAACTPDFFLFDAERKLVYRGQFDTSRPGNDIPVTGSDLRTAADALLAGQPVSENQVPSMGCNIKWTPGREPDYYAS